MGAPFLITFPHSYFGRAFEFGRQFIYKWTVNFKFLPEDVFLSRQLAVGLLVAHVVVLFLFMQRRWCRLAVRVSLFSVFI